MAITEKSLLPGMDFLVGSNPSTPYGVPSALFFEVQLRASSMTIYKPIWFSFIPLTGSGTTTVAILSPSTVTVPTGVNLPDGFTPALITTPSLSWTGQINGAMITQTTNFTYAFATDSTLSITYSGSSYSVTFTGQIYAQVASQGTGSSSITLPSSGMIYSFENVTLLTS